MSERSLFRHSSLAHSICLSNEEIDMTTITISLPDPLKQFVDRQVALRGLPGASEFFQDLVTQAISAERRAMIEIKLLEGSEAIDKGEVREMTSEDWKILRDEYMQRISCAQGPR
jgi:antitoxin ParD1/3/4